MSSLKLSWSNGKGLGFLGFVLFFYALLSVLNYALARLLWLRLYLTISGKVHELKVFTGLELGQHHFKYIDILAV